MKNTNRSVLVDYDEYHKMLETIKQQQEAIDLLENTNRIVTIDYCTGFTLQDAQINIPRITCDESISKEFLQNRYEYLKTLVDYHYNMNEEQLAYRFEMWKKQEKGFFRKLFRL
jgi:hypothetical protein